MPDLDAATLQLYQEMQSNAFMFRSSSPQPDQTTPDHTSVVMKFPDHYTVGNLTPPNA